MMETTNTTAPYKPKPGSLPYMVLTWMLLNPEEELTRKDVGLKFDVPSSSVDTLLNLPTSRGILNRKRNSEMEVVWCLGNSKDFVLDQSEAQPIKLPARCYPSTRRAAVEHEASDDVSEESTSTPPRSSVFPSVPPVKLDLKDIAVRKGVRLMTKEERRRAEFAEWFGEFDVGDSAEFDEVHLPTMKAECGRHMRANKTKFRFAETGPGRHGVERVE